MSSIIWLEQVGKNDVATAGGKGAQLGELKKSGFKVPEGFIITTEACQEFVKKFKSSILDSLSGIDVENTKELENVSERIQKLIVSAALPKDLEENVLESYRKIGKLVAVRSSATAEDQKESSFAGQMATFLNVKEDKLLESLKKCLASMFTARAIYYMEKKKIGYAQMAVIVQNMVDSEKAGVAFSINPLNNNEREIVIEAATGLGENGVSGKVTPDNYVVDKKTGNAKQRTINSGVLNDSEVSEVASTIKKIEEHYKFPQDVEWAIDKSGNLEQRKKGFAIHFDNEKDVKCKSGKDVEDALNELGLVISEGFSEEIRGSPASAGKAKGVVVIVRGVSDLSKVKKGDILVAVTTHPDYVPAMQKAAAIVTDEGGITSHAAIVARELGLPCIVGAKNATKALKDGDKIEVDATAGVIRKIKK